ncbi:unnamed protein product [Prunus armeniaca]
MAVVRVPMVEVVFVVVFHQINLAIPECQICSKRGHIAANCYYRNSSASNVASSSVLECQICGKKGHGALDCFHRSNYAFQGQRPPPSLVAMTTQTTYNPDQVWIIDSGATHHMVSNLNQLTNVTACDSVENVTIGNGEGLHDKFTKQILFQGKSSHAFLGQPVKSSLWHHRLGHPNNEVVQLMLKNHNISYSDDC